MQEKLEKLIYHQEIIWHFLACRLLTLILILHKIVDADGGQFVSGKQFNFF